MKQLNRFLNTKKVIYFRALKELITENEQTLSTDRGVENVVGIYDILEGSLYAILSLENRNYLFLKDEMVEITESIHVECHENWSVNDPSLFEVFHEGFSLVKVEYMNEHEGVLLPCDTDENWEEVNFGYELAILVNKAKSNPEVALFPNTETTDV
ncbi:hypothetical protein [Aquimarina sediminis]|uniref:hypothetical protein n=1 Tax=Aquimarina sediminis TaxID=2070536 RepID=UPI000CA01238|nr:hypothetical protein [Aquimarina sediminis]